MRKVSVIFVLFLGLLLPATQIEAAGNSQFIIINKRTNTLAFYDGGHLVRSFKVATGKTRSLTPEGKFRIVNKIKNRPYYTGHIAGGDPRNPLGDRWMGLEARGTYGTTYGIHGNNNENSIGKYVSHGCVRMHNEEVRWLFDQVKMFTTVVITYSNSSFDTIAQANGYGVSVPASGGIENENPAPINGWVVTNGKTYYYTNGTAKTGWQSVNGKSYYFDNKGVMKTGWMSLGGKTYYLDGKGVRQTGWVEESGKRYYFDLTGVMKTGWFEENGKWYYLDPKTGEMKTGWLSSGEKSYYFDQDGILKTGWVEVEGKWYYLNQRGEMDTGWFNFKGKWYYQDTNGVMNTAATPVMSQLKFYENPEPLRNGWVTFSGNRYYLGNNDGLVSSWLSYEGSRYYLHISLDMVGIR
ncbi:L,D-transpeptidase family protein [Neobacillus bataviensis]|uniref:L,D-transpeptidase family protein n=1 Tax=Neobacillus bataviensis TaxID=220685 RepID=UPI001CC0C526|nr:L,D-transpeptidase family protein [Neobacillus bataviensis]